MAFERVGVVFGDLYFIDPDPTPGQPGAERGVRLEVRIFDRAVPPRSIYAAQPISVGRPIWRADLLETVAGPVASFDRTHHHPVFDGWEPGARVFEPAMTADPVTWVGEHLRDLDGLLSGTDVGPDEIGPNDAAELRAAVPEIQDSLRRLLARVHSGELATAPDDAEPTSVRAGWL